MIPTSISLRQNQQNTFNRCMNIINSQMPMNKLTQLMSQIQMINPHSRMMISRRILNLCVPGYWPSWVSHLYLYSTRTASSGSTWWSSRYLLPQRIRTLKIWTMMMMKRRSNSKEHRNSWPRIVWTQVRVRPAWTIYLNQEHISRNLKQYRISALHFRMIRTGKE